MVATHQRNKVIVLNFIIPPLEFAFTYLCLAVWDLGWLGLLLPSFIAKTIQWVIGLIWVQKKILVFLA